VSAPITYVTTEATTDTVRLSARRGDREGAWEWPVLGRRRGASKIQQFLDLAEGSRLITYRAHNLSLVLSQPEILPRSRPLLGSLQDLFQGALLAVADAPGFELPVLAEYLGLGDAEPGPELLAALPEALAKRFAQLPRPAHLLLAYVLGETERLDYLGWPSFAPEELRSPMALVEKLAPRGGGRKRLDPEPAGRPLPDLSRELLSPGGLVAQAHPDYEQRPAQIDMAGAVAETFQDSGLLLVEAGTGVGKSLAYLVPAILWARETGKPVLVSTNTRNLQDQLIAQELPLLAAAMPVSFQAALLKGRRNYPCLRTMSWLLSDAAGSLFWSERLAMAFLIAWLARSPAGDLESVAPEALEELDALPGLVQRVRSQADACSGPGCPCRAGCRVEQARNQARAADIIVVNHALALEEAKFPFLPEVSHVLFDEAHNLEAAATENLAQEVSSPLLASFLSALGGEGRALGLVETLGRRLQPHEGVAGVRKALLLLPDLSDPAAALREGGDMLGRELAQLCQQVGGRQRGGRTDRGGQVDRGSVRLTRQVRDDDAFVPVVEAVRRFEDAGSDLLAALERLEGAAGEIEESAQAELQGLAGDVAAVSSRLREMLEATSIVLDSAGDEERYVTWAEAWERQGRAGWSLRAAPVDVGPLLRELFYDRKEAVAFTSATLSIAGEFRYFRQRLGLEDSKHELREASYPSPFNLSEQLLLCIPRDFPDPRQPGFDDAVTAALGDICEVARGGTLALFTSRARMEAAYEELEGRLADSGLRPLCQEVSGPRWWLLDQLRQADNVVLFGLKSFWEGVDVPGSALRCVVLCKLPFAVPDDPIVAARMESISRDGRDPWTEYYHPEAILGFKQGFGRLIRRKTDHGVVFVLDPRLLTKDYGKRFFRSIQRCGLVREGLSTCLDEARAWLARD
jgi:Rad3-related DNA helicase